ncbi:MAG: flagellar biosynthesis anti-sigma factor FlgM [Novosphingobium sp. 28-62-57]|uniref:flagellar biosynthesis anti-sigma factor FlgM n=1 Tax=unclassified Novosphingobium TaxID=2644732 RepID=UPI000BD88A49|nr:MULTISPECIES: flagellar biosynthesis anti-sigma factor FlgM [unclassified Novosphingobium]OYW47563.1 MAG: flagellar biosynthesis anti-sigma factor FlgM [Novosphingobium sp. 12-63-9]OYZ36670.1 MAG: flagellar biosynthesis anti-sigma factor FlgM [Novosphingobium sp. 16-62-11]OZA37649.1 MAG: flagellar biosynthesis anti-sigma factor FlgM [Novosphingobium sp. 17-62-9]OYZ08794.1 MAG: flagellar biosynthesis anti-sigma factor FlgM [Novosphingobium sp. 28-62-57]HQS70204.1 flagellar biosynthesis anti-
MSPIEIGAMRPVGPVQVNAARTAKTATGAPVATVDGAAASAAGSAAAAQVERSSALDAGQAAPVDVERVKVIRQAIEKGSYPVIPTKIADAMIAAQMLLRTHR